MRITQLEGNKEEEEGIGTFGKVPPPRKPREMCGGSEEDSYLRLIDVCIVQFQVGE